jgi:hypothetical protein
LAGKRYNGAGANLYSTEAFDRWTLAGIYGSSPESRILRSCGGKVLHTDLQSLRSEVASLRDLNGAHINLEFARDYFLIADRKYIQIIAMPPRNKGAGGGDTGQLFRNGT